jgi:hypothetical protein
MATASTHEQSETMDTTLNIDAARSDDSQVPTPQEGGESRLEGTAMPRRTFLKFGVSGLALSMVHLRFDDQMFEQFKGSRVHPLQIVEEQRQRGAPVARTRPETAGTPSGNGSVRPVAQARQRAAVSQ